MGANGRLPPLIAMSSNESPVCRVCGSTENQLIDERVSDAPGAAIYSCGGCSMTYLFPIMTVQEEAAFYAEHFEKYMENRAAPGYRNAEVHFRSYQTEGERRLPLVRPYLTAADDVLEIGSSTGYFLDDLRGYVRSVTGIEPGEAHRVYANGRGIETLAALQDVGERKFDVIALYYVLEHMRDPVDFLMRLGDRLRPAGRVLIEVPNVEDALLTIYRVPTFAPFYWQKAHYQNFSRVSLQTVLSRAGYAAELLPVQRYDLSNHMVWMMEGKPGGMGRYKQVFSSALEAAYADVVRANWVCDTLFAVARPSQV